MILEDKHPVLTVVDVQNGVLLASGASGNPHTSGAAQRIERIKVLIAAARAAGVPVVFVQEVPKRTRVDFGRELDGAESVTPSRTTRRPNWRTGSSRRRTCI